MNTYSSVDFNPFSGQEIQKICLTNESQKEIWLSCIFGGETASLAYNQSVSLYFKGKLNLLALQQSIDDVILTHEALRSNFSADGAKLMIYEDFPVELSYQGISQLARSQQKETVKEYIRREMSTAFNLENGPLLRAGLLQLDAENNVLILTTHHIITDGWSLNIMIEDLGNHYRTHCDNQTKEVLDVPFQISAYAIESLHFKESRAFLTNENFWLQRYKDGIPETNIPTDFPRTATRSYQGGHLEQSLSQELLPELKSISIESACSLFTLVLSAMEVFISKTIHQNQLVMGIFSAGRSEHHHTQLVGHCVNLLPLKAVVDPKQGFKDYLKKRKSEILDAIDHQQFTFSELIKKLYIPRDAARVPLVPIVFNFDTGLGSDASFGDLTVDCTTNPREYENFELNISILWKNDSATLHFTYNKDLFKSETIKKMMNGFDFFLHEIIHKPSSSIEELRIEDPQASLDRIAMRNDTHSPFSKEETLLSHVQNMVATYPKKTALRFHEEQLSFQELDQQSNQLAHLLLENGVQRGDNVGIALNRSPKLILSMLAVLKCGAVYIPLDPEFPHERIVYMLENSSATVLITSSSFQGLFPSHAKELLIEECWEKLNTYTADTPECHVSGNDLAYILYTSGSTGKPKGVQIRHYNLLNFLLSMQKAPGIKPTDKWLAITTVSFDIAGLEIFLPLISGAEIVLADESMTRNGAELLSIIRKQGITIMQATPATWTMMLYEDWEDKIPLKVLCGGEAFPEVLAQKLIVRSSEVWNMYGPTETTIWSTLKRLSLEDERITVGRPIDNTMVYILDENRQMVSEGSAGEIYIAGEGLAMGYMNRPELSLEKFVDNPFEPERSPKMYGTGDLGIALENGEIQCLGRLDHQVKIRGYRIELGEIEHVLNQNDSVKEAIVVAREDNPNDKRLCAYVIPSLPVDENTAGVLKMIWKQKLKEKLPPYMIPSDFVLIAKFPLTPNGKIDRKQLPKPGVPMLHKEKEQVNAIPDTPIAQTIAAVWAESLGVNNVNMGDDFFQLGGHSLLAVQLMMRLEKETGKKFPLTSLFKFSTFESFASLYEDHEAEDLTPAQVNQNDDHLNEEEIIVPTTESQKEIWLSCMIGGDQANLAYNLPSALKMVGRLNVDAINGALKLIVNRHEALRTNISESGESLIIHPHVTLPFEMIDLSMLPKNEQEIALKTFIHNEMNIPFSLSEDPLLRVFLHKLSDDAHYFTLITHHIICDGSSIDVFFDELSYLYNTATSGREMKLQPAPQLSNYALDQLTFNNSNNYHLTQQYWLKQYEKNVPVLDLPVDYPRTSTRRYKGAQNEYVIQGDTFLNFKKVTQNAKCSMVTSVLSAFELLIHHQTHQNEIAIGLPVSGQTGSFFGLIGHCVNLLPLRSTIDDNESFDQYVKRRSMQLYDDYDHQKLTYSELLKQLNVKRDATRIPLIPVMFSMRVDQDILLNGLTHEFIRHPLAAQTFEISLYVTQCEDELELVWVYNPDLFNKETIARFHDDFAVILKHIGQDPDLKIKDLLNGSKKNADELKEEVYPHPAAHVQNLRSSFAGPSTPMELLVADIWSEYLRIPITNIKSDFFELGGHSMIAINIMVAIEKKTGKKLPLSTLFENSTVESLARVIVNGKSKPQWESLVPIKAGGSKIPIYLIHGWGLNILIFKPLSKFLEVDQPVYGIQAQGLNGQKINSLDSVEKLASYFNAELLRKDPHGPYILAGYSFGGIIAFEMAKQLMAIGKEIRMLGILDTYAASGYSVENKSTYFLKKGLRQFSKLKFVLKSFINCPKETLAYQRYILAAKFKANRDNDNPQDNLDHSIEKEILKNYSQAYNTYQLAPLAINIDLFRVKKRLYYLDDPKYLAWDKYADQGVTIHDIPGDHKTFLFSPNVEQLAEIIQEALNARNLK